MSEMVRCPACGASNQASAAWCGQCLRRMGEPAAGAPQATTTTPVDAHPDEQAPALPEQPAQRPALGVVPDAAGVRRAGDALVWACPACGRDNSIEALRCSVCNTPLATLFEPPSTPPAPSPRTAMLLSAVLPGAGHAAVGLGAAGVARGVLWLWTLLVGLLLTLRDVRRSPGVVHGLGILFLLAAAAVWGLCMAEVVRATRGDRTLIARGRALTWATAALTFLLLAGLVVVAQTR